MNLLASRKIAPISPALKIAATPCNVVVVYEDRPRGELAVEFCRQLGSGLGHQIDLQYELWRFDVLDLAPARAAAAAHAAQANIIVFSARTSLSPTTSFQAWISSWLHHRSAQDCALVALLDSDNEAVAQSGSLHACLTDAALQFGVELFTQNIKVASQSPLYSSAR